MPPHSLYVEPFFGSGQIFWRKLPAVRSVIIDADAGMIAAAQARIDAEGLGPAVNAISGSALAILPTLALPDDAVVYCDPPYLLSTRTSRHRYKHEFGADQEHASLLTLLQALKCRVLLSGYPSKLYSERLADWRCIEYRTRTRGRTLTECLWCNFSEPTELHDWRFIGNDCRERLTLKRYAARFLARLDRLPELKRNFVLSLVDQRHSRR